MKRFLLTLGLWLGLTTLAAAQCVGSGGVNTVPQVGITCASEPVINTYFATGIGIVPASSATDIACLTGSATAVVRLQEVRVSGTAGTLVSVPITLRKNASADTGGTAATTTALPVPTKMDTNNGAATATTIAYTGNPTIPDSTPGLLSSAMLPLGLTGTTLASPGVVFDYNNRLYSEGPTLRGVAQQVCVNFNAVSVSSGVIAVTFRWTESAS